MPKQNREQQNHQRQRQDQRHHQSHRAVRLRDARAHDAPDGLGDISVGDRVRAKTTNRTGEVTSVAHDGAREQVTVSYDDAPQDAYLTTPAREGAQLPRELVDPA